MHCRDKRKVRSSFPFKIGSATADYTHQYRYLGFWINEFLDTAISLRKIYDHANRALGFIIAKSKAAGGLPIQVFSHLFNTLALSRINYTVLFYGQIGTLLK